MQAQPGNWQAAGPAPQTATFELSPQQNVIVRNLASAARLWGIVSVATGAVFLVVAAGVAFLVSSMSVSSAARGGGVIVMIVGLAPAALATLICGWFYTSSAKSLMQVVETQGNDIPLLMSSMAGLKKAFMIESICIIVSMVATLIIHLSWGTK